MSKIPKYLIGFFVFAFLIAAIIVYDGLISNIIINETIERKGSRGDFIGGLLNPILTTFTFFAILLTIHYQRQELESTREDLMLTREELKLTRAEHEKSAKALDGQLKAINRQSTESTLFNMLSLHNEITNSISAKFPHESESTTGRNFFQKIFKTFRTDTKSALHRKEKSSEEVVIDTQYELIWTKYQTQLSSYFASLEQILQYADTNQGKSKNFSKIINSQISDFEVLIIFYHCISHRGKIIKFFAEENLLFTKLDRSQLCDQNDIHFFSSLN